MSLEVFWELVPHVNVVVSHNHYDHMDWTSLKSMPRGALYYMPKGLGECLRDLEGAAVEEMDWWQTLYSPNGTRIVCLPIQHWSHRIPQATNKTLWAGYLLSTQDTTIYHGADSGYFIGYREFAKRYPGIDYALMPTTAYHSRCFMHYARTNIEEALGTFLDLGASWFMPMQWGTFRLGDDPPGKDNSVLETTYFGKRSWKTTISHSQHRGNRHPRKKVACGH